MCVIASLVAKVTFVVVEITFKVDVITSAVSKITFVVAEITFKVVVITSFGGQDHFCSGLDNF